MILLVDNYDSFTYNLKQYIEELGSKCVVFRNDAISLEQIAALAPRRIVISPGPGNPDSAGITLDVIRTFADRIPILGVCLGHQCLASIYGGRVDRAPRLMHGKTSLVNHNGQGIFIGIPSPFEAMRYHSLVVYAPIPSELEITATTPEGEIMGLKHKDYPTYGVQFHPESILTEYGKQLLQNFLNL